ncbi:MAG: hypothetical protein ACJA2K_000862 [Thalassolituus sp.]
MIQFYLINEVVIMAKAQSPVRLEASLMESAKFAGDLLKRSAAEQVEFWAGIGRLVAPKLSPQELIELQAGLLAIKFEEATPVVVDSSALFMELDQKRSSGAIEHAIASNSVRYQSSASNPGCLEQVSPDGTVIVGRFTNGQFEPLA